MEEREREKKFTTDTQVESRKRTAYSKKRADQVHLKDYSRLSRLESQRSMIEEIRLQTWSPEKKKKNSFSRIHVYVHIKSPMLWCMLHPIRRVHTANKQSFSVRACVK
jgi:hypothetical protein